MTEPLDSKRKIEFAQRTQVERNKENIEKLLRLIAVPMGWTEDQMRLVFVSDESSLEDFGLADTDINEISDKLGFAVSHADLLIDIVLRMSPAN
jgi:hypothetical protein